MTEQEVDTRMDEIERRTRAFAGHHAALTGVVAQLEQQIAELRADHMPRIREAVAAVAESREQLQCMLEASPDLFEAPRRTVVIDGVRVGMTKGKGKLTWEGDDDVVRRIRRLLPEQADVLIQTREAPVRKALSQLSAAELAKLGVALEDADDQIVIKPTDSEIDKVVAKLLDAAAKEEA